ncbi:MAG: M36 family metallopeptidase [Pyrinomonadaceae bacterium]|nr:M36 family metallopeptidase [Pyrinomonadaceae bacterium]
MQKSSKTETRSSILFCLVFLGLVSALIFLPSQFRSEANSQGKGKGLNPRTESHDQGLPNYDIRADKSAVEKIEGFRQKAGKNALTVADLRDEFVSGEESLKQRVPTLKVEYNTDIRTPEVIAPDVKQGRNFLTPASGGNRAEMLRNFVKDNNALIGVDDAQADSLKVTADYTNPDGNLSFAHLEQFINGVPVFRGEVKAGFTKSGEMIRVINNLAPGLDYGSLSSDFRNPLDAVKAAAGHINHEMKSADLARNDAASNDLKVTFGQGDSATTAEKMYFPTEPGVAVPAWRVLIWQPVSAYYVVVDAETGTMLWRKNITEDQTQASTYSVYANPNAMINVADNPFPLTPGPVTLTGAQGAAIGRTSISRIGNESPYTFNNNGWITDGGTKTDGNAIQAGLDRDGVDGVDTNSEAVNASRNFTYNYTPFNPNTVTGDAPVPATQTYPGSDYQQGSITQMFYIANWYHDELYRVGFTEQARNFQEDNFGRGGVGADRIRGEGQDSSGTNNANFSTPADGGRGRMQMYIWTGPNPDIDGNLDADVVIHEITHGTSNRLHGNGTGLSTNMSRGMGEGWSDFYAHSLLSEPTDPLNGIYTTGGYDTYNISAGFVNNYYYGIRRYPKALIGFTGGANNKPHNAYTFSYVNSDCNGRMGTLNFAFGRGPVGVTTCDQVHNIGEVWSSALWEVRGKFVTRLGWAVGNRKTLQLVTDGMKLAPLGPTMLQERDAILAAALASSLAPEAAADVSDVWSGFALRGMGFSASITNPGSGANNTIVVDGFDLPNLFQTPTFTVSDATGNNNGFPEPGENISLTIPLTNSTGNSADNTTLTVVGGGTVNYGTIATGTTVSRTVSYTVPAGTPCGSALNLTFNVNSSLGATSFTRTIIVGTPVTTFTENFDGVTAPAIPAGWTAVPVQSGINFVTTTNTPDTAPNAAFAVNPTTVGGGTDLTSPSLAITASAATVSFRHRFDTEPGWDGGALEISVNSGAFQDIITAGGRFVTNGYTGTVGAGTNNPLSNRNTWNGNSGGYITTTVQLPASAAGQNVQLKWRFGADDNTAGTGPNPGWYVDSVSVNGSYTCGTIVPSNKVRADFDGDGKTDLSVFRPSDGNWYQQRSTAGFAAVNWGLATDTLAPGDYDGDGKADVAVFRPSNTFNDYDFFVLRSSNNTFAGISWGVTNDVPTVADYDGDGKADFSVWRPSTGMWSVKRSSDNGETYVTFGQSGDVPVHGDYDGDGKADQAVWRPNANPDQNFFYVRRSSDNALVTFEWGQQGDIPVTGDFDGDRKSDFAVFRPSNNTWYIQNSNGGTSFINFGQAGDILVPGDYDGDGRDDVAVYRSGTWYLNRSTGGFAVAAFGTATDKPVPRAYF